MDKKITSSKLIVHIFFVLFSLSFLIPFILIISASFTDEASLLASGYHLFPAKFSTEAYRYVFKNPDRLINAYKVTVFYSIVATALSMLVMMLMAYPLSRPNYKYKKIVTFYIFFTMLFSGGLVPTYIVITKYLGLGNSIWVYIFPCMANAFHIIVIRTFFQGLPGSLVESAKIDGASELRIFFKIIIPLSKPVIATIALLTLLARWNDWNTALIYIRDTKLYSLQYLLQEILRDAQFIKEMAEGSPVSGGLIDTSKIPSETIRFSMCMVAAGPMLIVFPFFQKYFARGLTVGAVKG